jgi:hypothetical protein
MMVLEVWSNARVGWRGSVLSEDGKEAFRQRASQLIDATRDETFCKATYSREVIYSDGQYALNSLVVRSAAAVGDKDRERSIAH